jgi:hypothetical protein
MRIVVFLLLAANLTLLIYTWLDSGGGESFRLQQQVQPEKIKLLTSQEVAALGPAKVAALADVCVEFGPLSDADRAAVATRTAGAGPHADAAACRIRQRLHRGHFAAPNRAAADNRVVERLQGVKDLKWSLRAVISRSICSRVRAGPAVPAYAVNRPSKGSSSVECNRGLKHAAFRGPRSSAGGRRAMGTAALRAPISGGSCVSTS